MKKIATLLSILYLIQPITMASAAVNYQHDATASFFGEYIEPSEEIPEPPKGMVAANPSATTNTVLPRTGSTARYEMVYQVVGILMISLLIYTYRKNWKKERGSVLL